MGGKNVSNLNTKISLPTDKTVEAVSSRGFLVSNKENIYLSLWEDSKKGIEQIKSTRSCFCNSIVLKISELAKCDWISVFLENSYPFLTSLTLNCGVFASCLHSRQQGVGRVDPPFSDVRQLPVASKTCSEWFIMPLLLTRSHHAARDPPEHARSPLEQPGS